ncbi:MAG: HD domain-containing protein [Oscillospiraceae bacterium]|nr:HD domain-containing protein [Oscillospiraceae bacterium]
MINKAIMFAADKEKNNFGKYSGYPRIMHTIRVADIISKMTDDENVIAAAILYSIMEDCRIGLDEVKEEFGDRITNLVVFEDFSKVWSERKDDVIDFLCNDANEAQKKIVFANEFDNIRELYKNYDKIGEQIWERLFLKIKRRNVIWVLLPRFRDWRNMISIISMSSLSMMCLKRTRCGKE